MIINNETDPVVFEKKILNVFNIFLRFRYYLPLGKGRAPLFKETLISFMQECIA